MLPFQSRMLHALALIAATLPCFAQTSSANTLVAALEEVRLPLELSGGELHGSGGDLLRREIESSRFVLLGETHFTREVPALTAAICRAMHPDAYAVEAGPLAAAFVATHLHEADRVVATQARLASRPGSLAFLDVREENDLTAVCADAARGRMELWGLDQEYVGAGGLLLQAMLATKPGPHSRAALRAAQQHERAAEREASRTHDVKQLYMIEAPERDLQSLAEALQVDGNRQSRLLLHELVASHEIYRRSVASDPESRRLRAVLLKQHFLERDSSLRKRKPQARVLLKFGSMHMGRGFDPQHVLNLGNAVAEAADGQGVKALHVMVLGAKGSAGSSSGYRQPYAVEPFDLANEPQAGWLMPALRAMLSNTVPGANTTYTLYDLRELRQRHLPLTGEWDQLVYSYDLLIVLPTVSPSTAL